MAGDPGDEERVTGVVVLGLRDDDLRIRRVLRLGRQRLLAGRDVPHLDFHPAALTLGPVVQERGQVRQPDLRRQERHRQARQRDDRRDRRARLDLAVGQGAVPGRFRFVGIDRDLRLAIVVVHVDLRLAVLGGAIDRALLPLHVGDLGDGAAVRVEPGALLETSAGPAAATTSLCEMGVEVAVEDRVADRHVSVAAAVVDHVERVGRARDDQLAIEILALRAARRMEPLVGVQVMDV